MSLQRRDDVILSMRPDFKFLSFYHTTPYWYSSFYSVNAKLHCVGNKCILDLKGDSGDDIFVSRSFVLSDVLNYDADLEFISVDGGDGNDTLKFIGSEADDRFVIEQYNIYGGKQFSGCIFCFPLNLLLLLFSMHKVYIYANSPCFLIPFLLAKVTQ